MNKIPTMQLHSKGDNWFHFRHEMDSTMMSFTVSFIHDGTVVMTGDYGTIAWRRDYFPKPEDHDYGFPNKQTGISYFAEKICHFGISKKITDWKQERAIVALKDRVNYYYSDEPEMQTKLIKYIEENAHFDNEYETYDFLCDLDHEFGTDFSSIEGKMYGEDYSEHFVFVFNLLVSVSETIWNNRPKIVEVASQPPTETRED